MNLKSEASLQINKPIQEVYEAIVNPEMMTCYFISESTGRLDEGKELLWKFPEFEERFPITDIETRLNSSISFVWDPATRVVIRLEPFQENQTVVYVQEGEKELSEQNLKWALSNSGGWANFLSCLKAYLEYGINLRKDAFDFMSPDITK